MKIRKMVKLLNEAITERKSLYTEKELDYMKDQLNIIQEELQRIEHKNYKGFGKK
jgi:hypothetical protein